MEQRRSGGIAQVKGQRSRRQLTNFLSVLVNSGWQRVTIARTKEPIREQDSRHVLSPTADHRPNCLGHGRRAHNDKSMPGDVKMRGRLGRESVGRLSNGNLVSVPQSLQSEASQTALSQLNLLTNYCWQSSEHGFWIDFVM